MRRSVAPILGVATLQLRSIWRSPGARIAVVAFVVLLAIGHGVYWSALPPRAADDRMFGWAYLTAMFALLRFGLAEDRTRGFDEFLVINLVTPARYVAGKLLAAVTTIAAFAAGAFVLAYALGGADWEYAAWYTTLFTLVAWVYLPAVLIVELAIATRYPAAFVFVAFAAGLTIARAFTGTESIVAALGFDVERFAYASLGPLARRALVSMWLLVLLYPVCRLRLLGRAGWLVGGV